MKLAVEDWMTKHPFKIDIHEGVESAKKLMHDECIRHLLVVDEGNLMGVLSEEDLRYLDKLKAKFKNTECYNIKITAGDLMGRNPITVSAKTNMADAIRVMSDKGIHSLPVKDEFGRLRGILTSTDVMRYALVASQHIETNVPYSKPL